MNACETSRPLSRRARLEASDNTECKPSMLGVGLEIPNFRCRDTFVDVFGYDPNSNPCLTLVC